MIAAFDALWEQMRPAFAQERTWRRARTLALSALVGLGRRTVTGMLSASAQTGVDWSAAYRLFERERFDKDALFAPARRGACSRLRENDPLVVLMDDTLVRKRGRGGSSGPRGSGIRWGRPFATTSYGASGSCSCRRRCRRGMGRIGRGGFRSTLFTAPCRKSPGGTRLLPHGRSITVFRRR
jgi:hypothetical protein